MPFDGKPSDYAKPDVFSVEGLLAWLDTQDPATKYDYDDCEGGCLIGTYLKSAGVHWSARAYAQFANMEARWRIAGVHPWTYGAAAQRCRDYLARQP